jgi:L-ascorbate metabolism protein UlaG (beta-lactamase superfamily)
MKPLPLSLSLMMLLGRSCLDILLFRHSCLLLPTTDAFSASPKTPTPTKISNTDNGPMFRTHVDNKQPVDVAMMTMTDKITLTYLEINGWLLTMNNGMTVLIDPILEGPLDFGIPDIFKGTKRVLPTSGLTDLLPLQSIDCLSLTQGLDDHAHVQTLTKLRQCEQFPKDIPIVAPRSAQSALEASGWYGSTSNIRFVDHGQETIIIKQGDTIPFNPAPLWIQATTGALVGPPWQRRENGYILTAASSTTDAKTKRPISLYIEPHVEFNPQELSKFAPVDVVITPTTGQTLPAFELVHGPKDSVRLIETLRPRYVVPMPNADIDTSGMAAPLVSTVGSPTDFERGVAKKKKKTGFSAPTIVPVKPGKDIVIEL